ncbi:MAG TPA: ATP-grasp domain-containing protein [Edaphobacter sp.]
MKTAIVNACPDIVVPCDDGVVWQLHDLHTLYPELRPLIEHSLGPGEMYPALQSRVRLMQVAAELGIRTPFTRTIEHKEDLADWCVAAPAVLKLDGTWGGEGVEIVRSPEAALMAFEKLIKPNGVSLACKRLIVNRDPLAFWSLRRNNKPSVTIQQFVLGRPANTMFVCWRGEVLSMVTVEVLFAQGATGAATVVRVIQNAEITQAAQLLARQFMLNGFHGLDFILEDITGSAYLLELNPRCTQLGHLRFPGQGDLAGMLSAKLKDVDPPQPKEAIENDTIAFFPQAFSLNPKNPFLSRGYHDVPWEEPRLFHHLLREAWPERQWPARIYHFFRPPKPIIEMKIEAD